MIRARSLQANWDLVLALVLACASACGLAVVTNSVLWQRLAEDTTDSVPVGKLIRQQGDARFRPQGAWTWREIWKEEQPVAIGDRVFTGGTGVVLLELDDGNRVRIDPNTLITVSRAGKAADTQNWFERLVAPAKLLAPLELGIQVGHGNLRVDVDPKLPPLEVEIAGRKYDLSSRKGSGAVDIAVDPTSPQSPALFKSEGNARAQILDLSGERIRSFRLKNGESAVASQGTQKMKRVEGQIADALRKKSAENASIVARRLLLTEGAWRSRFATAQEASVAAPALAPPKSGAAPSAALKAAAAAPKPEILQARPVVVDTALRPGASISELKVSLSWEPKPGAKSYLVQVLGVDGDPEIEESAKGTSHSLTLRSLDRLQLSYRIVALLQDGSRSAGAPAPIRIELSQPKVKAPAPDAVFNPGGKVFFSWERLSLVGEFEVEVSASARFDQIIHSARSRSNLYGLDSPKSGIYYWRVRALVPGGKGQWSETRTFVIR